MICINHALEQLGHFPVSFQKATQTIGLSLEATYQRLPGDGDPAAAAAFKELFVGMADHVVVEMTVVYDFVPGLLEFLGGSGWKVGIVSTKYRRRIDAILARERLAVDVVIGGEDVVNHKPHPESLLAAAERLSPARCAGYLGDSVVDGEAAARASIPFVGVLTGTTSRSELKRFSPLTILKDAGDLVAELRAGKTPLGRYGR